jgi:hypothetical protein
MAGRDARRSVAVDDSGDRRPRPAGGHRWLRRRTRPRRQHSTARASDWIEVNGRPGWAPRRGQILEVLGRPGHERYRVRWDEQHESLFYPTECTAIVHRGSQLGTVSTIVEARGVCRTYDTGRLQMPAEALRYQ